MAVFDSVIEDVAGRFGLGGKAGPLLHEVVQLMTSSPGGIGGFIESLSRPASMLRSAHGSARPMERRSRGHKSRRHSAAP